MAGAGAIKAGGAYIEIGAVTAPLRAGLRSAGVMVKGFVSSVRVAARGVRTATRAMTAGFKVVAAAARRTASAIGGIASRLKGFAVTTVKRGMMALATGLGLAVHHAVNFESAMAEVATIADVSAKQISEISAALLDLAGPAAESPVKLARGLYQAISAGIPAAEAVEFLGVAAKSAAAGMSDTFTAVNTLTTILNSYGIQTSKATLVSDVLFKIIKRGKTTYDELGGSIGRVTPIAAAVGVPLTQIGAALGTLTKGGLSTDEAVTSLRATLVSILKPSEGALKKAKELGIEWNVQALRTKGLVKFLMDVKKATKGDTEALGQLVPNVRAITGVLSLVGPMMGEFADQLDEMRKAAGATNEAFSWVSDTIKFRLKAAYDDTIASLIKIGNVLLPGTANAAEWFAKTLGKVADWVEEHSDDIKAAFETMSNWIKKEVLPPLRSALDSFFKWLKGDSETTWEGVEKKATGAWKAVKEAWEGAKTVLQPAIDAIKAAAEGDWKGAWEALRPTVVTAIDGIIAVLKEKIPKFVNLGIDFLQGIVDGLTGEAEGGESVMKGVGELIGTIVGELAKAVAERAGDLAAIGVTIGLEIAGGIIGALADSLGGFFKKLREILGVVPGLGALATISKGIEALAAGGGAYGGGISEPIAEPGGTVGPGTSPGGGRWAPPAGAGSAITVNILEPRSPQDTVMQIEREANRGRL